MKHLLVLIVLVVAVYAAWTLADPEARKVAVKSITQHAFRIGFFIGILLLLVAAAVNLPSTHLL